MLTIPMESLIFETTAMAHGGAALGRHEGKVVFVPYALPGEQVRVELVEDRERYAHARLLEVLTPAPERVPPPCPYFGPSGCGGCQWQHASYQAQLRFKTDIVADQLRRLGKLEQPNVQPILPDSTGWAYRNQARFHPAGENELGFYSGSSHKVVAIEECLILHPLLAELYASLELELEDVQAMTLRVGTATQERLLVLEMEEDEPPALFTDLAISCVILLSDGEHANLIGSNYLTENVAGYDYRISGPSFFQANTSQAGVLVQQVLTYLDLQGGEQVLDGYCGVGLFTLPLAERSGLVVAVEVDPPAVDDLVENTADVDNVEVVEGPLEAVLPDLESSFDAAVVDPPRTGLERRAVEGLVALGPRRIVYVSCDPATLARDGRQLGQAGYHLVEAQPVDMFPQSHHIEVVSLWERVA